MITACGGGDDHAASTTTTAEPRVAHATVPASVQPGVGWLALAEDSVELKVIGCAGPDPAPADPTSQRRFALVATATVDGEPVTVKAAEFASQTGAAATRTQTVTVASKKGKDTVGLESKRSFFDGRWLDLDQPTIKKPLFVRHGSTLEVTSKFGPQGSRQGDPGVIDGAMIAACPRG